MVAISSRFVALSSFCALAALYGMPFTANAAVVPGYRLSQVLSAMDVPPSSKGLDSCENQDGVNQKEKRFHVESLNPVMDLSLRLLGRRSPKHYVDPAHHTEVTEEGERNHISYGREDDSLARRRHRDHDHDGHHYDKIVVKGDDNRVRVHDNGSHGRTKVIIKGDNDRVRVHSRDFGSRSISVPDGHGSAFIVESTEKLIEPRRHHRSHRHGHGGGTLVVKGDHQRIDARDVAKREQEGVPGRVDIMSPVDGSDEGKRLASLCLTEEFTLNACEQNQTVIYLVAINSASNTTEVQLQIPVYDPQELAMASFCATFDPDPSGSEPLTVERCFASANSSGEHKSQTFDYVKDTGIIRPMQYTQSSNDTAILRTRDEPNQNLTLVFAADAPVAAKSVASVSIEPSATASCSETASVEAAEATSTASSTTVTSSLEPSRTAAPLLVVKGQSSSTASPTSSMMMDAESVASRIADQVVARRAVGTMEVVETEPYQWIFDTSL